MAALVPRKVFGIIQSAIGSIFADKKVKFKPVHVFGASGVTIPALPVEAAVSNIDGTFEADLLTYDDDTAAAYECQLPDGDSFGFNLVQGIDIELELLRELNELVIPPSPPLESVLTALMEVLFADLDGWASDTVLNYVLTKAVRFDAAQALSNPEKLQARTNINAVGTSDAAYLAEHQSTFLADHASLTLALEAVGPSARARLVATGIIPITVNTNITKNISLKCEPGTDFAISAGIKLTIENGAGLEADPTRPIFSGLGNVYFSTFLPPVLYPEWWNALGDGVTDDIHAFDKIMRCYPNSGKTAVIGLSNGKRYFISSTWHIDQVCHVRSIAGGCDNHFQPSEIVCAPNSRGIVVHHASTRTGVDDGHNASFSRIENIAVTGDPTYEETHTVDISGLAVTKTAGIDLTSANGFADGKTITVKSGGDSFEYVIRSLDSANQVTIYKPRLLVIATAGETRVVCADYNTWMTNADWVGQNLKIDGVNYAISDVSFSGSQYFATLATPYTGRTPTTGEPTNFTSANVDAGANTIALTAHPFTTGNRLVYQGSSPIGGLDNGGYYFAIKIDANTIKVAATYADAIALNAIDLTSTGTGAMVFSVTRFVGDAELQSLAPVTGLSARTNIFDGITLKAPASVVNCQVWHHSGDGIALDSNTGLTAYPGTAPNNNNTRIDRNSLYYNKGSGIWAKGVNSNQGQIIGNDCTNNHGAGIFEGSFLGNILLANHTSFNYFGGIYAPGEVNSSLFLGEYGEGGQPSNSLSQFMLWINGNPGNNFDALSRGGYLRQSAGRLESKNIFAPTGGSSSKLLGAVLGEMGQENVVFGLGAAEFAGNLTSGGTAEEVRVFELLMTYDKFRAGYYALQQGGQAVDATKVAFAIAGEKASEPDGTFVVPKGFRTGFNDSHISKILIGVVGIDPASINAATFSSQTFSLPGAILGDKLELNPPSAGLTAGILVGQYFVSAADEITICFYNTTGGAVNLAAADWSYKLTR